MELTTVWSGAHKHTYLCIPEWTPPQLRNLVCEVPKSNYDIAIEKGYRDWSEVREQMLVLLAQRPRWKVRELRQTLGLTPPVMAGLIFRAQSRGLVRRLGMGVVMLIRRKA